MPEGTPLKAMSAARMTVPFRGGGFVPGTNRWISILTIPVLVAIWHLASVMNWVSPIFLPGPASVANAFVQLWAGGEMTDHITASLFRIGTGWVLGTIAGLAAGVAVGIWNSARSVGLPIVSAIYPIPKIALLPLLILWFGIGEPSKVVTIALGVFFPTVISGFAAVDTVPRNLIRMAQSFGLPHRQIVAKIVLPGAMPGILAGFRISVSTALMLVVSAEMIGARFGIGAFVLNAGNLMQTDQLLAGVIMLSILGLAVGWILSALEKHLLRWR